MSKGSTFRWPRRLWRALGSNRLTLILLSGLLLASLLASLFPQMPADATTQAPWLSAVTLRYGKATPILHALGLFDAYGSAWYLAILAALLLNTLACTLQRLPRLWRSLTRSPRVGRPEAFYQGFARQSEWPLSGLEDGLASAQETLHQCGYHLRIERDESASCAHIYAERGRWARAGTVVTHFSALLLVLIVLVRPAIGWRLTGVTLLPGQSHVVALSPPLIVRGGALQIERHPDGQPRDYRVPLAIVDSGHPITRTVAINHPLHHRGVAFHLQGYGPAARIVTEAGVVDLALSGSGAREVAFPETGLVLRVVPQPDGRTVFVEALSAEGTPLGSGVVGDGEQVNVAGTAARFELGRYTVWQVSSDPTFALAVLAASVMLAGVVISLWVPQRRLWLRLDEGKAHMVGAGDVDRIFDSLVQKMAGSAGDNQKFPETEGNG